MALYVSVAKHDPLLVQAVADIAAGWRKNERGYGFFDSGSISYPGDRSVEVTLNVRARPFGFDCFPEFPKDIEMNGDLLWSGVAGLGLFVLCRGKVGVLFAVDALKEDLERNENELIHFDKVVLRQGRGRTHIRMVASVGIRSAPAEPRGDIPEWNIQFFQGGLPSLGKKRP